ncbi:NADH:ubiquinone oxidoreductase [Lunasporangiospora selenospora]|uniref:NADH:ubiquinone oxidoreductase n=1 Tax=Lunasporangiospora selenospora TaxID=979761 RepID=A0A9P6KAZ3_9FUNG|nr:NADH:ubiquinone oxidoreductase [Lunasporangiospora selenospora]
MLVFASVAEELDYYKSHSKDLEEALLETKYTLDEFQQSSKELEEELEKEIDSTERRYNEIKIRNEAMRQEVEDWKDKYGLAIKESNVNIGQLTRQLEILKQQMDTFVKKGRELEQDNDDLERTERAAKWSLQELEIKYNAAVEKTAMLEGEVSSKVALIEELQRVKDELRDVNVELAVIRSNQSVPNNASSATIDSMSESSISLAGGLEGKLPAAGGSYEAMPSLRARLARSAALQRSSATGTSPEEAARGRMKNRTSIVGAKKGDGATTGGDAGATDGGSVGAPIQNPVRMVQEMVGRVKSLEARLVSCRSLVTPLLQPPPSYSTSNRASIPGSNGSYSSLTSSGNTSPRPSSPGSYSSPTSPRIGRRTSALLQQHLQQHKLQKAQQQLQMQLQQQQEKLQ